MYPPAKRASTSLPKFLDRFDSRQILSVKKDETIFHQGDRADALFYLISGRIRYSVSSPSGKDAMLFVFADGDFFGERCLTERGSPLWNRLRTNRGGDSCASTRNRRIAACSATKRSENYFSARCWNERMSTKKSSCSISSITANSALPPCSCAWRAITATITNACE